MTPASSFDTFGWFARTPAILARVGEVLLEETPRSMRPNQLLMAEDAWHAVGPEVAAALKDATKIVSAFFGKEQKKVPTKRKKKHR